MGIKSNFNSFIYKKCPSAFKTVHLSEFAYQKIAIDVSLYLHKFKAVCGENWLSAFINLILSLRRNDVHCFFVFDGEAPPEKNEERQRRRADREKMERKIFDLETALSEYKSTKVLPQILVDMLAKKKSPVQKRLLSNKKPVCDIEWFEQKILQKKSQLYEIDEKDYEKVKILFDNLGIPYMVAPQEAEKMCSFLAINGHVSAVLSEDSDVLAYGTPFFLTKIKTSDDTAVLVDYSKVLEILELNSYEFLEMCIICGTDYNNKIPGEKLGVANAHKNILKYKNIDNFQAVTKIDVSPLKHVRTRFLFTDFEPEIKSLIKINYCTQPNYEKLYEYSKTVKFDVEKIKRSLTREIIIEEECTEEQT